MRNLQNIFQPVGKSGQAVTTSSSAAANAVAIGDQTYAVRLVATTDTFVDFEATATKTTGMFLPAGRPEVFAIASKAVISHIADASAGKLYITELTA